MAQPLKRARVSVGAIFVGIVGFLVGTTLLSHYVERWRAYPTSAALKKVNQESVRLSHQARYLSAAQQKADNRIMNNRLESAFAHRASGAPVVFNRIAHISVDVTIACLVAIFVVAVVGCVKTFKAGSRSRLILPAGMFLAAGGLFIVREIAYHSDWVIGSFGFWSELWQIMHGHFGLWPAVVFPLFTLIAIVLLAVAGAILLRRGSTRSPAMWVGGSARAWCCALLRRSSCIYVGLGGNPVGTGARVLDVEQSGRARYLPPAGLRYSRLCDDRCLLRHSYSFNSLSSHRSRDLSQTAFGDGPAVTAPGVPPIVPYTGRKLVSSASLNVCSLQLPGQPHTPLAMQRKALGPSPGELTPSRLYPLGFGSGQVEETISHLNFLELPRTTTTRSWLEVTGALAHPNSTSKPLIMS